MRALILHGPGDLRLEQVERPQPADGEVILQTRFAMTCATDAKILRNGAHPAIGPLPAGLGHEMTGTVVEVGQGVPERYLGREVVVANSAPCGSCRQCLRSRPGLCAQLTYLWGTFAEFVRIPARIVQVNMLDLPAELDPLLAPLVEPLACAIHAVERSGAASGDQVVVLGGGVQGQFLTACLAARGCTVITCDPHPDRRERARRFGASETADAPRDERSVQEVRAMVGGGADAVFEAVGRPDTWITAVALAGAGGEVNLYGGCPPGTAFELAAGRVHYEELRIQGSYHHTPSTVRAALEMLREAAVAFHELVGTAIQLDQVAGALAASGLKRPVVM